jgi:peptidoglycan/LPS O-acetylase OafA/YrhL
LRLLKTVLPAAHFEHAPAPLRWGLAMGNFAAVILAAILLYYCVENPARSWLRRRFESPQMQK